MQSESARVLVPIADGTEEMEFTIVVDVLRRADVDVVTAGVAGPDPVTCSRGVRIVPDIALDAVTGDFDWIVLPGGGPGAAAFRESVRIGELLAAQLPVADVCAVREVLEWAWHRGDSPERFVMPGAASGCNDSTHESREA